MQLLRLPIHLTKKYVSYRLLSTAAKESSISAADVSYAEGRKVSAVKQSKAKFEWKDPFCLRDQLSEEERIVQESAFAFVEDNLFPG